MFSGPVSFSVMVLDVPLLIIHFKVKVNNMLGFNPNYSYFFSFQSDKILKV